jgi:hypothetical protein
MPALLSYLIAVTLLLGGGYGALNWLATPEPVKVAAKTAPKPSPPHYTDNSKPDSTNAQSPQVTPPEPGKPEFSGNDQAKVTANGKAVDGKAVGSDPPPAASSPQPEPPVAASQQEAEAVVSEPDRAAKAGMPEAASDQGGKQQHAEAPPAEAKQDDRAPARHEEQKQSVPAVTPDNGQTVASLAPVARTAKRPHVRQANRDFEKRSLEVMTLRTIELPDGRRISRLLPYRDGDRHRYDDPALAFSPDE